jgi:hypothetical protein
LRASCNVLRPERQPAEFVLDGTEQGKRTRKKQIVSNPRGRPTSFSQSLRQIAGKNELRIHVERAGVYRMDGKGVQWIMLEDGDQSARFRNPVKLPEPHGVLVMGDVVKDACRKDQVESIRFGGYAVIFDQKVVGGIRIALFAERKAALGHIA